MVTERLSNKESKFNPKEIGGFYSEMMSPINKKILETCNRLPIGIRENARKILSIDKSFTERAYTIYERMKGNNREIPAFFPFFCALKGYEYLADGFSYTHKYYRNGSTTTERVHGMPNRCMAVVDYSKSPNSNRFYLIRMGTSPIWSPSVMHVCTCVSGQGYSHRTGKCGKDTAAVAENPNAMRVQAQPWENSNTNSSYLSSPGFLYTPGKILSGGSTGRHLEVHGLEPGFNDNAYTRNIYVHGGNISEGCFVVPTASRETVLGGLQNGGMIFSYFADDDYLRNSSILNRC